MKRMPKSTKSNNLDKSTLNFNKKEEPNSQKMFDGRFQVNLHVKETYYDFLKMIQPKGINIIQHGIDKHKNRLAEGTLVTVYCNNKNPDVLCQREYDELMDFVNRRLRVIRDSPPELRGFKANTKIITQIDSEDKADKAFNLAYDENGNVVGQL